MTHTERLHAVTTLGFTERQARFLITAALHSGYCVRRQYASWAGIAQGRVTGEFFDKLVARRLATRTVARRDRGWVYHLSSPALYAALGEPHNRNRRQHPASIVMQRLMTLDFVLARQDAEFVATERDKVRFFIEEHGLSPQVLPAKTYTARDPDAPSTVRHFVDRRPIFTSRSARVWVAYVLMEKTAQGFRTFLLEYLPLLDALPRAGVVLIATSRHGAAAECARIFDQMILGRLGPHFHARAAWERGDYGQFHPERVRRLKADLQRFASPAYQHLYRRWCVEGDAIFAPHHGVLPDVMPVFELFEAPYAYDHVDPSIGECPPVSVRVRR